MPETRSETVEIRLMDLRWLLALAEGHDAADPEFTARMTALAAGSHAAVHQDRLTAEGEHKSLLARVAMLSEEGKRAALPFPCTCGVRFATLRDLLEHVDGGPRHVAAPNLSTTNPDTKENER